MQPTKQVVAMAALALVAGFVALQSVRADKTAGSGQRSFAFTYEVHVPGVSSPGQQRLWIPLPLSTEHQSIHQLLIESTVAHSEGKDGEYGNSYAVFSPTGAQAAAGYDVALKFEVTRQEFARDLKTVRSTGAKTVATMSDALLQRYLQPDKMVPLNARIAELAKEQTEGARQPLEKARRIYTYVASTMRYDKSGEGWGRGDAMWACDSKRGNCTDFHSVLIGMMRSSGIPARFEIGFPLPEGKSEGDIPGYHCWAEFYLDGVGWVPVDASEASKFPAKRDYFFGAVDADRVMFSYGRDIRLSTEQQGEPLNYFIYPYAEANGRPLQGLKTHFAFHDLAAPGAARSGR